MVAPRVASVKVTGAVRVRFLCPLAPETTVGVGGDAHGDKEVLRRARPRSSGLATAFDPDALTGHLPRLGRDAHPHLAVALVSGSLAQARRAGVGLTCRPRSPARGDQGLGEGSAWLSLTTLARHQTEHTVGAVPGRAPEPPQVWLGYLRGIRLTVVVTHP